MLRYKIENPTNQWTNFTKTLDKKSGEENKINQIVNNFVVQLKKDEECLGNELPVSDCGLNAPRLGSHIDKTCSLGRKIALVLYPIPEDQDNNKDLTVIRKWSYIRYQQLISRLTRIFKDQIEKEETIRNKYKEVRRTNQRKYFCELKKMPVSDLIINPKPMPVEIASLETLSPFLEHLRENKEVLENKLIFERGVQYDDGRMDLCKQVVGPTYIGKLMDSLVNNSHVEHFLLGNNIINYEGATEINKFLTNEHIPKIKTWYLAGNEIDDKGVKLICEALEKDNDCEALWLKRNPIKIDGAKHIAKMLENNGKIKILDLHNTGILDQGCQYIFESLKKNRTLRHIYVDANAITPEGIKYVANYFDFLVANNIKGITSLWMDINRIDDEGCIVLAESLRNYRHLKRLIIGSNRITEKGTEVICDSLVDHEKLIVLDLGLYKSTADLESLPNDMKDAGAKHIANFLRRNRSVKVLNILHNDISANGLEEINNALQTNNTILYIYYEQYGIGIPQELKEMMKRKLTENIRNNLDMDFATFMNTKLRFIKGSEKLKNIDSIYRNNM